MRFNTNTIVMQYNTIQYNTIQYKKARYMGLSHGGLLTVYLRANPCMYTATQSWRQHCEKMEAVVLIFKAAAERNTQGYLA
jgi:hypothetical protein